MLVQKNVKIKSEPSTPVCGTVQLETNLVYRGERAEGGIMATYVIGEGKHVDLTAVVDSSAQH